MNRIGDSLWSTGVNKPLVRAFLDAGVEFIVVGGLAVSWHWLEREADDMDLLLNPTAENSIRVVRALRSQRLETQDEISCAQEGLQIQLKESHYAELLTPRNDGESYVEIAKKAVKGKIFNFPVLIAGKETLIAMKMFADNTSDPLHEKHRRDLKALRSLV
jgi:hypothetical protein